MGSAAVSTGLVAGPFQVLNIGLRMRKVKWRLPEHWQDDATEKQF
jgi:hypothetical protein